MMYSNGRMISMLCPMPKPWRENYYMQHTFVQLNFVLSHGCIDSGFEWTKNVHGECLTCTVKG